MELSNAEEKEDGGKSCVVFSRSKREQTNVLFECALREARRRTVAYVCVKSEFEANRPLALDRDMSGPDGYEALKRIHMKYVQSWRELLTFSASIHLRDDPPHAIVVDGFEDMFRDVDRYSVSHNILSTLSLLNSASNYLSTRQSSNERPWFSLVVGLVCEEGSHCESDRFAFPLCARVLCRFSSVTMTVVSHGISKDTNGTSDSGGESQKRRQNACAYSLRAENRETGTICTVRV